MRVMPALLLSCVVAACGGASAKRSPATTECSGERTFVVNNRSNRDVDVIANVGGSAQAIGTVRAGGNDELILPKGTTTAYTQFAREGSTVGPRGRVDTRYSCRP